MSAVINWLETRLLGFTQKTWASAKGSLGHPHTATVEVKERESRTRHTKLSTNQTTGLCSAIPKMKIDYKAIKKLILLHTYSVCHERMYLNCIPRIYAVVAIHKPMPTHQFSGNLKPNRRKFATVVSQHPNRVSARVLTLGSRQNVVASSASLPLNPHCFLFFFFRLQPKISARSPI